MFEKVVFAGGGNRCWWQAGFWDVLNAEIELRPRVIAGVSAGAATACMLHASNAQRTLAWYERELAQMRGNVRWSNLFRRGEPLLPHAAIYRKALRATLGGARYRHLMWSAPEIRVQFARLPPGMGPARAVFTGMLAYTTDKYLRASLHPTHGARLGFTQEVRRVQDCRSERELIDLLIASSCTPPFTPIEYIDGAPCLDGGLVDNVPIGAVADVPGHALVLTTRRYKRFAPVFVRDGHVYVQPTRKIEVASWDYASPRRYRLVYEHGRADAEAFLRVFALGRFGEQAQEQMQGQAQAQAAATDAGIAEALSADQPASSDGQLRSARSPSTSRI